MVQNSSTPHHYHYSESQLNFLAHALLAGDKPALIVGGVIGDWIKGILPGTLPDDLAQGVALHRAIDNFAETNPAFRQSRSRCSNFRRRYAGVVVDVIYDHLLAKNWADHHHIPLNEYCAEIYSNIHDRLPDLPDTSHPGLKMMLNQDWLTNYQHIDEIADVLARMSRRIKRTNPLAGSEQEFLADVDGFTSDFYSWLEDAKAFSEDWIAQTKV